MNGDLQLMTALEGFYMKWLWRMQLFRIDDSGMLCRLNYGHPFSPYIPAQAMIALLQELCGLAKMIENTLTDK